MADLDRGAYAPPTDTSPLAFDARQPRRRRPLPITLILSVLILLGLIAAMIFIYRQGVGGEGDEPQQVGDPVGAVREPPPAEAQPVDPASGLDVYTDDGEPAAADAPVFTAPPETPVARPAPVPAPVVTGTTGAARPPALAPAPPRAATQPQRTTPLQESTDRPEPPTPAERAAERPATPPVPAPTPPAAPPATAAAVGRVSAQIGAFNTRAQAQAALAARPGGAGQRVEEVQRNGATLYRAIVTGFPDRAAAQSYCSGVPGGCVIR